MAEDSTIEYISNDLYEVLDENEVPKIEQVYMLTSNDDDDSDEQFVEDGNFPIIFYFYFSNEFYFRLLFLCNRSLLGGRAN